MPKTHAQHLFIYYDRRSRSIQSFKLFRKRQSERARNKKDLRKSTTCLFEKNRISSLIKKYMYLNVWMCVVDSMFAIITFRFTLFFWILSDEWTTKTRVTFKNPNHLPSLCPARTHTHSFTLHFFLCCPNEQYCWTENSVAFWEKLKIKPEMMGEYEEMRYGRVLLILKAYAHTERDSFSFTFSQTAFNTKSYLLLNLQDD